MCYDIFSLAYPCFSFCVVNCAMTVLRTRAYDNTGVRGSGGLWDVVLNLILLIFVFL